MDDLMSQMIIARLISAEWELSFEMLQGGHQSEEGRTKYVLGRQDAIIARAVVLIGLAQRVTEQSTPEFQQAKADEAAAIAAARLDASRNQPWQLRMAEIAVEQGAADKLEAAGDYVDECKAALVKAEKSWQRDPGLRDTASQLKLDRLRQEFADAQAAFKSLLASKGRMSSGMEAADAGSAR